MSKVDPLKRHPVVVPQEVQIEAMRDHVVMIIRLGESTVGVRFISAKHILEIMSLIMDKAVQVWPDDPWVKEYLSD